MRVGVVVAMLLGIQACKKPKSELPPPALKAPSAAIAPASAANAMLAPPTAVPSAVPAPPPAVSARVLAESRAPHCEVAIEALLDKNVYRGSPSSPMKWDSYKRDPKFARFAQGEDHGAEYLSCEWRVRVNGALYSYKRASHTGPARGDLRPEQCNEPAEAKAAAKAVVSFTDGCKDLHRGEYYGDVLVPLDGAPR